jgi:hypothetical protein
VQYVLATWATSPCDWASSTVPRNTSPSPVSSPDSWAPTPSAITFDRWPGAETY